MVLVTGNWYGIIHWYFLLVLIFGMMMVLPLVLVMIVGIISVVILVIHIGIDTGMVVLHGIVLALDGLALLFTLGGYGILDG